MARQPLLRGTRLCPASAVMREESWVQGSGTREAQSFPTVPCAAVVSAAQARVLEFKGGTLGGAERMGGVEVGDWARPLVKLGCEEGKGAVPGGE